jgi:hypothetical protein
VKHRVTVTIPRLTPKGNLSKQTAWVTCNVRTKTRRAALMRVRRFVRMFGHYDLSRLRWAEAVVEWEDAV